MNRIVTVAEAKAFDRFCIEQRHIPSRTLMATAAEGVFRAVLRLRKDQQPVTVLAGSGNNGGDGVAAALLLHRAGIPVTVSLLGDAAKTTADTAAYLSAARDAGVSIEADWKPRSDALLVDALLGVGLTRDVSGSLADTISKINASGCTVVSVDVPSGLDADTGCVCGAAVRAFLTVTLQYMKTGLLLGQGRAYAGDVAVTPLAAEEGYPFSETRWLQSEDEVQALLPPRPFDSHKGANGHALLCVGSPKYIGAALLSSRAALRSGCGLLTVVTPNPVRGAFSTLPEAITVPTGSADWDACACEAAIAALDNKTAIGVGCGVGDGTIAPLLKAALSTKRPLVLDADALNQLAKSPALLGLLHENVVLTPHVGEMARLLGCSIAQVQADPLSAASSFPCTVLLKGATTLVHERHRTAFCVGGNAGLAKGGSGDVLTGIITALLAQGLTPFDAARVGAHLLGVRADRAMNLLGERMLLASDLLDVVL